MKWQEFFVKFDNMVDVEFRGVLLASISHTTTEEHGNHLELRLYKTKGGKFICSRESTPFNYSAKPFTKGRIASNVDEVFDFFGFGFLSRSLYEQAKLETVRFVK